MSEPSRHVSDVESVNVECVDEGAKGLLQRDQRERDQEVSLG